MSYLPLNNYYKFPFLNSGARRMKVNIVKRMFVAI